MARRVSTREVVQIDQLPPPSQALQDAERAMSDHMQLVVAEYGDGLPWDPAHYQSQIRNELRRGFEALLRAGRLLVVAKECAPRGEWCEMLSGLGVSTSQAARLMEAARRTANVPALEHLGKQVGTTKFFDLLALPDEELARLAEGDALDGVGDVDEIERMTTRDLQAALRSAKADIDAKEQVIASTTKRLQSEQEKSARLRRQAAKATPSEKASDLRKELAVEALQIEVSIMADDPKTSSLRNRVRALVEHAEQHGEKVDVWLAGVFAQLERSLFALRDEFGIERVAVGDPAIEARFAMGSED